MKILIRTVITLLTALTLCGNAFADFKLPSSVYTMNELDQAQAESVRSEKPIAVIYTSCTTNCGLVKWATEVTIDELKKEAILVHYPRGTERPKFLKDAYQEGRFIPKVAVLDSSLETIIGETHYEAIKKDKTKAFEALLVQIEAYKSVQK